MNDSYLEVLKQYEGEVTNVRRGRGAWICEYPDGPRLLKEYRGTVKRLEFEDAVLGQLEEQGICRTDRYVRNLEDVYSETLVFRAGMQSQRPAGNPVLHQTDRSTPPGTTGNSVAGGMELWFYGATGSVGGDGTP